MSGCEECCFLFLLFQETVIQEGDYIRLRIVGTRVDANDIVSRNIACTQLSSYLVSHSYPFYFATVCCWFSNLGTFIACLILWLC